MPVVLSPQRKEGLQQESHLQGVGSAAWWCHLQLAASAEAFSSNGKMCCCVAPSLCAVCSHTVQEEMLRVDFLTDTASSRVSIFSTLIMSFTRLRKVHLNPRIEKNSTGITLLLQESRCFRLWSSFALFFLKVQTPLSFPAWCTDSVLPEIT